MERRGGWRRAPCAQTWRGRPRHRLSTRARSRPGGAAPPVQCARGSTCCRRRASCASPCLRSDSRSPTKRARARRPRCAAAARRMPPGSRPPGPIGWQAGRARGAAGRAYGVAGWAHRAAGRASRGPGWGAHLPTAAILPGELRVRERVAGHVIARLVEGARVRREPPPQPQHDRGTHDPLRGRNRAPSAAAAAAAPLC
eukprot:scaffold87850_cov58-Phaeocystis_antarctica.AAC.1